MHAIRVSSANRPCLRNLPGVAETTLLVSCARLEIDQATEEEIRELCADAIDWTLLLDLGERHELTGLLYTHLNHVSPQTIPANILKALKVRFVELARRSMLMAEHLTQLVRVFERRSVACVPFGTPFVSERFYDDVVLTPVTALEFFVPENTLAKAQAVLAELGYSPLKCNENVRLKQEFLISSTFPRVCDGYIFVKEPEQIYVKLRWRLVSSGCSRVDRDLVCLGRESWVVSGQRIQSFSSAAMLLLLCAEASVMAWRKIGWVTSVAEIVNSADLDWDKVYSQAKRLGLERALLLGLYLTKRLPATDLPDCLNNKLAPARHIAQLGDSIIRSYYGLSDESMDKPFGNIAYQLALKDTWWERVALRCAGFIKPSLEDCIRTELPDQLYPVYYLLHPINMATERIILALARMVTTWKAERDNLSKEAES